jgi:hypothetical protein
MTQLEKLTDMELRIITIQTCLGGHHVSQWPSNRSSRRRRETATWRRVAD